MAQAAKMALEEIIDRVFGRQSGAHSLYRRFLFPVQSGRLSLFLHPPRPPRRPRSDLNGKDTCSVLRSIVTGPATAALTSPDTVRGRQEHLSGLAHRAAEIAEKAQSANTRRAYRSDWADFSTWCAGKGLPFLPAEAGTVILYLTDLSSRAKASTLARRVATISQAHEAAGLESPSSRTAVRLFLRALRRDKAGQGITASGKRPILGPELCAMLGSVPPTLLGMRDRALLLLGYLGAFRRSELVALDVEHIEAVDKGLIVHLRRSKTDQEGKGQKKGIPKGKPEQRSCPVQALADWIEAAGLKQGPLFRPLDRGGKILPGRLSDRAVARAVKRYAKAAHLDPACLGGHSLRAGLATAAAIAGKSERAIMNQTGHRSVATARRYIRDGNLFRDNAAEDLLSF